MPILDEFLKQSFFQFLDTHSNVYGLAAIDAKDRIAVVASCTGRLSLVTGGDSCWIYNELVLPDLSVTADIISIAVGCPSKTSNRVIIAVTFAKVCLDPHSWYLLFTDDSPCRKVLRQTVVAQSSACTSTGFLSSVTTAMSI